MTNNDKEFYDISVTLGSENINFPLDTPFSRQWACTIEGGAICNVSKLVMSAHAGTHIDLPLHFLKDGKPMEEYPVERFILPAVVTEIKDKHIIRTSELQNLDLNPGDALLFKTDNSTSGRNRNGIPSDDFVHLTDETADFCIRHSLGLVGIDYTSIEPQGDETYPLHIKLMSHDILILESINLNDVPPGRYTLCCLPLKLHGAEASPVRAILQRR